MKLRWKSLSVQVGFTLADPDRLCAAMLNHSDTRVAGGMLSFVCRNAFVSKTSETFWGLTNTEILAVVYEVMSMNVSRRSKVCNQDWFAQVKETTLSMFVIWVIWQQWAAEMDTVRKITSIRSSSIHRFELLSLAETTCKKFYFAIGV